MRRQPAHQLTKGRREVVAACTPRGRSIPRRLGPKAVRPLKQGVLVACAISTANAKLNVRVAAPRVMAMLVSCSCCWDWHACIGQ